jgi:hypothetical protein
MKPCKRALWGSLLLFSLFIVACVTINIYFPAEKVESVAGEIVNDIRGQGAGSKEKPAGDGKTSYVRETLLAMVISNAWAEEVTSVSNATIRALKEKMKGRYGLLKPYYQKGMINEGGNGYASQGNLSGLGLKEKRDLLSFLDAENRDRKALYEEIARAMNIDPSQIDRIGAIFAKEWQKPVR